MEDIEKLGGIIIQRTALAVFQQGGIVSCYICCDTGYKVFYDKQNVLRIYGNPGTHGVMSQVGRSAISTLDTPRTPSWSGEIPLL
jgi:hypothetical protein